MAIALYRKYRPTTLEELKGQESIVEILKNAAINDRIGHGYLFYGPRGTGKTTTARLLAKILNCRKRAEDKKFYAKGEPCNTCTSCTEIARGASIDLIEIDAASNRGIDEIRNLKESIRVGPAANAYKIYIIDEAHMLTKDAANALLKTLEEPPPYAVIILATTEYEKLPATIVSRTQRFLFKKITKHVILKKLSSIAKTETFKIENDALELIAASAEGSLRDAESLLDQARSIEPPVTLEAVEKLTGRIGLHRIDHFASLVLSRNLSHALAEVQTLHEEGHNVVQFTRDLIHYLRKILTLHYEPSLASSLAQELTDEEIEKLKSQSKKATPDMLIPLLTALIKAYGDMPYSPFAPISLEIALVSHLSEKRK